MLKSLTRRARDAILPRAEVETANSSQTPFTEYVISRMDSESQRMFAMSFAEHLRSDADAKKNNYG